MKCLVFGHRWINTHSIRVDWVINGENKHIISHLFACAKCGKLKKPKKIRKDGLEIETLYEKE